MALTPTDPTKAQIWIRGTAPDQIIDLYVPRGAKGDPGGFTQGTLIGTGTDWNNLMADGIYRIAGQASQVNMPGLYPYGILMVNAVEPATRINQVFYPGTTGTNGRIIWSRGYAGGIWSSWRSYTPGRWDTTAGRAMYMWDPVAERDQLVYGDTGWRLLTNPSNAGGGSCYIRRIGYQVYLKVNTTNPTDATGQDSHAYQILPAGYLPSGFAPAVNSFVLGMCRIGASNQRQPVAAQLYSNGSLSLEKDESNASGATVTSSSTFNFSIVYDTTTIWPTTLPGSASGSIPNT
ncbi:hypothetical protein SEA_GANTCHERGOBLIN_19 [Arthrobacter phage GantcherGoblin]|nr:hypothetical protein SEA_GANTCHERGOBLIN_19 [Arthrobacter phage GantcherGoblin]